MGLPVRTRCSSSCLARASAESKRISVRQLVWAIGGELVDLNVHSRAFTHELVSDGGSQAKCLGNLNSRVNAFSDASEKHAGIVDVGDG